MLYSDLRGPPLANRYWFLGVHYHNHSYSFQRARSKRTNCEVEENRSHDTSFAGYIALAIEAIRPRSQLTGYHDLTAEHLDPDLPVRGVAHDLYSTTSNPRKHVPDHADRTVPTPGNVS